MGGWMLPIPPFQPISSLMEQLLAVGRVLLAAFTYPGAALALPGLAAVMLRGRPGPVTNSTGVPLVAASSIGLLGLASTLLPLPGSPSPLPAGSLAGGYWILALALAVAFWLPRRLRPPLSVPMTHQGGGVVERDASLAWVLCILTALLVRTQTVGPAGQTFHLDTLALGLAGVALFGVAGPLAGARLPGRPDSAAGWLEALRWAQLVGVEVAFLAVILVPSPSLRQVAMALLMALSILVWSIAPRAKLPDVIFRAAAVLSILAIVVAAVAITSPFGAPHLRGLSRQ
jgi:hypothetical protein